MKRLRSHIDELETLMDSKGYDGHFLCNSAHPGKLRDSLYAHLLETLQGQTHVPPFYLTTFSHWKDEERPYVKCDFKMKYDSWTGFRGKIEVKRANHFGTIKSFELRPNKRRCPNTRKGKRIGGTEKRSLKL